MSATNDVVCQPEEKRARFSLLSEQELQHLVDSKDSRNTKHVIHYATKIFTAFCEEVGTTIANVEKNAPADLCLTLRNFYAGIRQNNAQLYSSKSMITIRYGLQRYFLRQCGVDIINSDIFKPANDVFSAMLVKLKGEGKGATQHKEPITKIDMTKII